MKGTFSNRCRLGLACALITIIPMATAIAATQTSTTNAPRPAAPATTRTVASVKQVMHAITIPASEVVFKAAGDPPTSDEAWTLVERQSIALAESGNLLMIGSRVRDRGAWLRFARSLVDASASAVAAAAAKNPEALSTASDAIYETCETCHNRYMKK